MAAWSVEVPELAEHRSSPADPSVGGFHMIVGLEAMQQEAADVGVVHLQHTRPVVVHCMHLP